MSPSPPTKPTSAVSARLYEQTVKDCLEISGPQGTFSTALLERHLELLQPHVEKLREDYLSGALPLLRVPDWRDDIVAAQEALDRLLKDAKNIIFLGTGGSSLGGQTLAQFSGLFGGGKGHILDHRGLHIRFLHNLDASTLEKTLSEIDLKHTRFVIISKSGGTSETLLQAIVALQIVIAQDLDNFIPQMFLGLTENRKDNSLNGLRVLCEEYHIPVLEHDRDIGGRYSGLTNVGMLAAMACKLDPIAIREGAAAVIGELMEHDDIRDFAPAVGAAVAFGLNRHAGIRTLVLMPYADRLEKLSKWYVQLWAESLGKDALGSTPLAALGPLDQHSQLQLFLDGPPEYMVTLVRTACEHTGIRINPKLAELTGADYLVGRRAGDLVAAEQQAVYDALRNKGRPVRAIDVADLNEHTIGALMMHFMIETILAARLYGVNPFDQPAVELGKKLTKDYLASMNRKA